MKILDMDPTREEEYSIIVRTHASVNLIHAFSQYQYGGDLENLQSN
jgi:hypothetical protein